MNILKKEQIFNRWLIWVEYTNTESCLLEIMGEEEPSEETIKTEYDNWVIEREKYGTTE